MRLFRLLVLGALVSAGATAQAEPLLQPPGPVPVPNDDEPEPPLVPNAADTLGGHIIAGANGALIVPWGDLSQGVSADDLGTGLGVGLDLGYGVSRSVVVGLWGQYTSYGDKATGYAVGPFVRYHLVQGTRFDPWLLAGLGYRALSVDSPAGSSKYSGVEWLRLGLGGDYYPWKSFGFGPFAELDAGVYGSRPEGERQSATHLAFILGLRLILDVPGK